LIRRGLRVEGYEVLSAGANSRAFGVIEGPVDAPQTRGR
jgi:hypothetical protein